MQANLTDILRQLNMLTDEKKKKFYLKQNISEDILGINLGPLRKLAGELGIQHSLGQELWNTNIYEARVLATMVLDPSKLDEEAILSLLTQTDSKTLIDELSFQTFEKISDRKARMNRWIEDFSPKFRQAGWNMAVLLVIEKQLEKQELEKLLEIIEKSLADADTYSQFSMNRCLSEIGIHNDDLTQRCLEIAERLGVYRDWKVSKGCTSPYAVDWINVVRKKRNKV